MVDQQEQERQGRWSVSMMSYHRDFSLLLKVGLEGLKAAADSDARVNPADIDSSILENGSLERISTTDSDTR